MHSMQVYGADHEAKQSQLVLVSCMSRVGVYRCQALICACHHALPLRGVSNVMLARHVGEGLDFLDEEE